MNIYFIDYDRIKENAWKYLKDILKVKMVFSFLPDSEVGYLRQYFHGTPFFPIAEGMSHDRFSEACVYELADYIKSYHVNRSNPMDTFSDRAKNGLYNILHFGYENVMILGNVRLERGSHGFVFQECVYEEEEVHPGWVDYDYNGFEIEEYGEPTYIIRHQTDRASALFRHLKNLLVKQLGLEEDIFSKRIRRYLFDGEIILIQVGPDERTTQYWWAGATEKFRDQFKSYINRELNKLNPREFPSTKCECWRYRSTYYRDPDIGSLSYLKELLPQGEIPEDYIMTEIPRIVNLGLPSGTLWCERNLGAEAVSSCGHLYCWGDLLPYQENSEYVYRSDCFMDARCYFQKNRYSEEPECEPPFVLKKACNAAYYSSNGRLTIPFHEDFQELFDNCKWEYIARDGYEGYMFYGRGGSSLFLPIEQRKLENGHATHYWTKELSAEFEDYYYGEEQDYALCLNLDKNTHGIVKIHPDEPGYIRPIWRGNGLSLPSIIISNFIQGHYGAYFHKKIFNALFASEKTIAFIEKKLVVTIKVHADKDTMDLIKQEKCKEAIQDYLASSLDNFEIEVRIEAY